MTTIHLSGYTTDQQEPCGLGVTTLQESGFGPVRPLCGLAEPSYAVRSPDGRWLYAVSEGAQGRVAALDADSGEVACIVEGMGADPCHLALSDDGALLVASAYSSGSVALLAVDGPRLERVDTLHLSGEGPHERQDESHAHQATFLDPGRLLVCDLGSDRVVEVAVDAAGLREVGHVLLPPGTGPRHLVLAPDRQAFWVVGELDSTVHPVVRTDGGWRPCRPVSLLAPGDRVEDNTAAGIVVDRTGRHVYVTVRGVDTLSHFRVGEGSSLEPVEVHPTGAWPRFLGMLSTGDLVVAAEQGDTVALWRPDAEGRLRPTGIELAWPAPTWVAG